MKKLIILYFIAMTSVGATAEVTAPFGLNWGESKRVVTQKGVQITDCKLISTGVESCMASNLPKSVSFGEMYKLIFDSEKGLQKTMLIGVDITNDPYGTEGKSLYSKLKKTFIKKYPSSEYDHQVYEYIGYELYKDSDEFYECLDYSGCGNWATYILGKGSVVVQLNGLSRGKGWIGMTHESPEWGDIIDKGKAREDEADIDAL